VEIEPVMFHFERFDLRKSDLGHEIHGDSLAAPQIADPDAPVKPVDQFFESIENSVSVPDGHGQFQFSEIENVIH
jgi:hypothetical protein